MYVCVYIYIYICKCRDSIVVRVLGWDMQVPGSIPADVNYMGYASDTSKSLGECLRLRSNHNLYLNGRLAESNNKINIYIYICTCIRVYVYIYIYIYMYRERPAAATRSRARAGEVAADLRAKTLESRGFDASRILIFRGGILMSIKNSR